MRPVLLLPFLCLPLLAASQVLIVADEFPAMETLAAKLRSAERIESRIVEQTAMPADLSAYPAVIVYIHRDIHESTEKALIDYTRKGGKLVLLHHSISSGKRKNRHWLPFAQVDLPTGDVSQGGYKWIDPVKLGYVDLAPGHFITTRNITYPDRIPYTGATGPRPGFVLDHTEVYLNHVFTGPRTILLGIRYQDPKTGQVWMQDRGGWYMRAGQGWIFYLMAGHSTVEFEHPVYSQVVVNAVVFRPE